MDYRHIYDISFVSFQDSKELNPHIVFSMSERHLGVFREKLLFITPRINESVKKYLGIYSEFTLPYKDLFGNYTFGYNRCGYMIIEDGEIYFNFNLSLNVHCIAMTINVLLRVLNNLIFDEDIRQSNRWQFIQIDTVCEHNTHGHSMGGSVSPDLGKWLKKQGESIPESESTKIGFSPRMRLPEVEEIMNRAWNIVTRSTIYKKECIASVAPDGRFSLVCPGDACDVSIYPDQSYGDIAKQWVRFSCHNLDSAQQQLTLLSGLTKLCELARQN